jgi:uncharacterized glyoxalase superfamily protein PhnB
MILSKASRAGIGRSRIIRAVLFSLIVLQGSAAYPQEEGATPATMKVRDLYPLITAADLDSVRDFYVRHFDFEIAFEASWFLYLTGPADGGARGATLAFMTPAHPSSPPGPETFDGQGMILTLEVSDASAAFARLTRDGAPIVHPLTDEDWGQRRFMTRDPAGVLIDVVQQTEPKQGYWDRYMIR